MQNRLNSTSGQIFPFLTLILVIVLIAAISYVNLGIVSGHKVDTMNAADAGALAGVTELASAANTIADYNVHYLEENFWAHFTANVVMPGYIGGPMARLGTWSSLMTEQVLMYLDLCLVGYRAAMQASALGHMMAYSNMEIEEAQRYEWDHANDKLGTAAKSNFAKWFENPATDFYADRGEITTRYAYRWSPYDYQFSNNTYAQRQTAAMKEEIHTTVQKPDEGALVLHPEFPIPQPTVFLGICASVPCNKGNWCDPIMLGVPKEFQKTMYLAPAAIAALMAYQIYDGLWDAEAPESMKNTIVNYMAFTQVPPVMGYIQHFEFCIAIGPYQIFFQFNVGFGMYFVPVPWIARLDANNADLAVQVSRFSPERNLGIWQFKHGVVASGAQGHMYGGDVFSPGAYQVQIDEVWDGEKNL